MSTSPEPGTPAPDPAPSAPAPMPPAPAPSFTSPWTLEQLLPTAFTLVVGLAWGALMLIVLGFWMRSKNEKGMQILTNVFLISGAVSAGLAVWQAFTLWFKHEAPAQKADTLGMQRRILGYFLLLAGLGLIGASFVLGLGKKPSGEYGFLLDNLAESIGVLLFAVIALGSGYLLTLPPSPADDSPMRSLVGKTPMLKLIMVVIGALAFAGFFVLAYRTRAASAYMNWIPELTALLFLSVLCFTCVLWLNAGQFEEVGIRLFVLVFGGSLGLILFLFALARAYTWRQDVLLGGMAAWQGPNGWHGWLVIYVQIVALILMFVSFSLARTDIRSSVTLRRVMYGYDTLLQGLLLFEFLCVANVVIGTMFLVNYDWTATRGVHALAPASMSLVRGLKKEINVVVLMRQGNPVYKDLHNLLDNCSALNSTKFKVTYLSPEGNLALFEQLVKNFPKISPEAGSLASGVLLINGPIPDKEDDKVVYSFVPDRKIHETEGGRGQKTKLIFKGEAEVLKEVKFLAQDKKKHKIYVLQGNEEPDINNKDERDRANMSDSFAAVGIGGLVDHLQIDNYDVFGLNFGKDIGLKLPNVVYVKDEGDKKKSIPADCGTLIVAGASNKLPQEALDAIESYMDRGGKMLVFLDVVTDADFSKLRNSGMEAFVKKYGVEAGDDFALRFPLRGGPPDARDLIAFPARKTDNPLAREFSRPIFMRKSARVVRPGQSQSYRAETILQLDLVQGQFLYAVEKKANVLINAQKYMIGLGQDEAKFQAAVSKEPIPVAVAVSQTGGGKDNDRPCMVVFGDTEFITNRDLERLPTSYAFVTSSIEWMSERETIGANPKVTSQFQLPPGVNFSRMIFLPGWIMLVCLVGLGVSVWIVRRR